MRARAAVAAALAALLAALAAAAGCAGEAGPAAGAPAGDTRVSALADPDGDGFLAPRPGEALRVRGELGAAGAPGRTLATLGHLTDLHVRDEESPARAPFLDRLGDPFNSTFRPHEALSPHVLAAAVRSLNAAKPDAVLVTGDLVDSAQANELEQVVALLAGGRVRPDSGARGYDGVQARDNPDPLYYRPGNDPPRHPGLLALAQRPFAAEGLRAPWLPALGNHDLLVQGEVPPSPRLDAVARGGEAVVGLDPEAEAPPEGVDPAAAVDAALAAGVPGRRLAVAPDPARRHVAPEEAAARLGRPAVAGRLDYAQDVGRHVRVIVLDTVNRAGGSRGLVLPAQVAWLRAQLAAAGERWVIAASHNPLDGSDGGEAALAALDAAPRVAAAVSGHRHRHAIAPRRTPSGGYWLVSTASLADHPQQGRVLRLRAAPRGAVLETWVLDHDGRGLAGVARELAFLDAQGGRPRGFAGRPGDRNARLPLLR